MLVKNLVLNVCVNEDGEMYVEMVGMSNFGWLENMLDGVVFNENGLEVEEVGVEVGKWFDEEVVKYDDVESKDKLKVVVEEFKEKLSELLEENDGFVLVGNNWGVEYDNNYGVVVKLFEGVELEEVVEEEEE